MLRLKLAVRLEAFGLGIRDAIDAAARLGATGVQFDAAGDLAPAELSQTGRRHFRHLLATRSLDVVAVGVGNRRGFDVLEKLEARIARTKQTLAFAREMGAGIAVSHIGKIPENRPEVEVASFADALRRIGNEGDRVGASFAIHTALDAPPVLAKLLGEMKCHGLAVYYDPANVLGRGVSLYEGVRQLAEYVVGVQVKDVVRTGASISGLQEVPIGSGEIDWPEFFGALEEINYRGPCILNRETGERRVQDLAKGLEYLSSL